MALLFHPDQLLLPLEASFTIGDSQSHLANTNASSQLEGLQKANGMQLTKIKIGKPRAS
jgi:hypothetical protein